MPELPLHELLALEAVARLGSVQAAAEALHVTASGISHRIASLQRRIGSPLRQRQGRGVALTPAALACVEALRPGLIELSQATARLRASEHGTVRVATAAAIGAAWLVPALGAFAQRHPGTRLELRSVATPDELPPDRWDLLIHYGDHPARGSLRKPLFREQLVQVCAPALRGRRGRAMPAAERVRWPSLRLSQLGRPEAAADAAADSAAGPSAATAQLVFDDALAMLEACAAGAGVAWTTTTAAAPYLADGRLVRASAKALAGALYVLDLSETGQHKVAAKALCRWLVQQAGARSSRAVGEQQG